MNAVNRLCNSGYLNGNATVTFRYTNVNQGSFYVELVQNHYGLIANYGCTFIASCANGPGGLQTQVIQSITSGNGGSWSIIQINSTTFDIKKNAGTYGGGGYYMINITGAAITTN